MKRRLDALKVNFRHRDKDLCEADRSRSLYSLHKPVKEVSIYPEYFSGDVHENFFKFKEKFLEALKANQVYERNKVQVLCKHLKCFAKETVTDDTHFTSINEAFEVLELVFGNTRDTWRAIVKDFQINCSKPDCWKKEASSSKSSNS